VAPDHPRCESRGLIGRLEETHGRADHVLIPDLGPADKVDPRVESLGKSSESVKRTAIVV
jgi:CRISPR-associated protein Cas2